MAIRTRIMNFAERRCGSKNIVNVIVETDGMKADHTYNETHELIIAGVLAVADIAVFIAIALLL